MADETHPPADRRAQEAVGQADRPGHRRDDATVAAGDTPCVVGFAAETHDALSNARGKLARKGCHAIIVNDVSQPGIGFDSDDNAATLVTKGSEVVFPRTSKTALATQLVNAIAAIHQQQRAASQASLSRLA